MGPIKEILAETQFQEELTSSSQTKLVIVDFTASWCGPCQTIAPFYEQLSRKYPNAVFLKVDVDKCQETAVNQRVSVMPTFHFYRNKVKVDSMQGADPQKLEEKIQKYYDDGTTENDVGVAGHVHSSKKFKQSKKAESKANRDSKSSDGRNKVKEETKAKNVKLVESEATTFSHVSNTQPVRTIESKSSLKNLLSSTFGKEQVNGHEESKSSSLEVMSSLRANTILMNTRGVEPKNIKDNPARTANRSRASVPKHAQPKTGDTSKGKNKPVPLSVPGQSKTQLVGEEPTGALVHALNRGPVELVVDKEGTNYTSAITTDKNSVKSSKSIELSTSERKPCQ